MTKELHPVTELLLARMKSHPDEFKDDYLLTDFAPVSGGSRWEMALRAIKDNGSEQDLEAINEVLGAIRMEQVHEWTMDELLNGEERRRKRREETEYYATQAKTAQAQLYQNQYANAQTALGAPGAYYETPAPENTGLVAQMKKALGL